MATKWKFEMTLDLPSLAVVHPQRNLCVRLARSFEGNAWRAALIDLEEFRGHGSTRVLAIDQLATELECAAAEIRRASSLDALLAFERRRGL
jgi:hypothetical protein